MDVRALQGRHLLAAAVFLAATLVLAIQLITPSPVVVSVGDNGTEVAELGGYFRYADVAVVAVAAALLGASGASLLIGTGGPSKRGAGRPNTRAADGGPDTRGSPDPVATGPSEPTDDLLEARRDEWEETADRLANNERLVYEAVLEADGVLAQADIVDQVDLSKATVSRTLDSLEAKNLLERKRRGMGNVVLLR